MTARVYLLFFIFCTLNNLYAADIDQSQFFQRFFVKAHTENGYVSFRSPYKIKWEEYAPSDLKSIDIANPIKDDLNRLLAVKGLFNFSTLKYKAELTPDKLQDLFCNFISPYGTSKLGAPQLSGSVDFEMGDGRNEPETKIIRRSYGGRFLAKPARVINSNEGGFVLCSKRPLEFEISYSGITENDVKEYFNSDDYLNTLTRIEDPLFWKVIKKYTFKIIGYETWYVFFQLAPDDSCHYGCCGKQYFVAERDKYFLLEVNQYNCDV